MLTPLEATTIARAIATTKRLLEEIKPILDGLNIIYDAATVGVTNTITQPNLDASSNLSGLTKTQLDAAMNALTFTIRPGLTNAYAALATLAARG